jgi:SAM-dependent methyltransferase
MMLHWMENPREALAHWRGFLKPNGRLLAALPVSDSLFEWRDLIRAAGLTDGLWAFPPENFAAELCLRAEFRDYPATYAGVAGFLRSLKGSGAHRSPSSHRPAPAGTMRRLRRTHREPLTVTFRIAFLILNAAS